MLPCVSIGNLRLSFIAVTCIQASDRLQWLMGVIAMLLEGEGSGSLGVH